MEFVDLKRRFAVIGQDDESNLEIGRFWGSEIAGWLDWTNLLEHRRVALLAEAASGKTEEFRYQAAAHAEQGRAGFYVRIEDLADDGFENALEPSASERFNRWRNGDSADDGWFFLDAVDEARLNRKSLVRALRRFSGELGPALERARVYISCRVSDWQGREDRDAIERWLPVREAPTLPETQDEDAALLDPIFPSAKSTTGSVLNQDPQPRQDSLFVVQLVPLDMEQRKLLAVAAGVERLADFITEIERNGLDALAERPGDLIDMAGYWNEHGCFGSLAKMTEHGVTRKLAERDKFRPDNAVLSPERARHGAEQLAAALTLAKSFTLHAPGHDLESGLAAGAIDPAAVLDGWTDAERNALTRRGVFAPASYGRIRFHHRGTQEYLTASWLRRLLRAGCPRVAVWDLIFAERYGIETLVPSLHPVAAWLALDDPAIRDEIVRREPLVLVRHGDPRSLPLEVKERLLPVYAERHLASEIGDDSLDHQALWMFATPGLADAIRRSWAINDRTDFRRNLLRVIREGQIRACADLARGILLDDAADDALRPIALEAADSCGDVEGLEAAARWLIASQELPERWFARSFALVLFPRYLTVDALLDLVARSSRGFDSGLVELWKACPNSEIRERFIQGIADLCLSDPFVDEYRRVSARHYELAKHLTELASTALSAWGDAEPSNGLLRVLMVVERADGYPPHDDKSPPLGDLVSASPRFQRALFWADVGEIRKSIGSGRTQPTALWALCFRDESLWRLGSGDLTWLYSDVAARSLDEDRRLALSAILSVLESAGSLSAELPRLRALVA